MYLNSKTAEQRRPAKTKPAMTGVVAPISPLTSKQAPQNHNSLRGPFYPSINNTLGGK